MPEVGIIGAGTMGHGIAQCFAVKGWQVRLYDVNREVLDSAPARIRSNMELFVEVEWAQPESVEAALRNIALYEDLPLTVRDLGLVIETVSEQLDLKRRLFAELEKLTSPETILCTNTSALSITSISRELKHPERVLGTHFWNPPHILPCVEVIKSETTSDRVFEEVVSLLAGLGKEPVRVLRDVPGFVGNRMQHALQREAMYLVDQGIAAPEEVDRVVKFGFGLRLALMGPLERSDWGGLDITYQVQKYLLPYLCNDTIPSSLLARKVAAGELGAKTGQGWFDWPEEKKTRAIKERDRRLIELIRLTRPGG
jgi:3-hydroxybutyryl-CoA dehydrogenase